MKIISLFFLVTGLCCITQVKAQAVIGADTVKSEAILNISSTTQGALFSRMTSAERTSISSPATGLIVFDTDSSTYLFYNGSAWENLNTKQTTRNVGMIGGFANASLPSGWLELNGQTVDAANYPALASMFPGWVSGSDVTLPDYRGYFLRGTGTNGSNGAIAGPNAAGDVQAYSTSLPTTTLTLDNAGAHTHSLTFSQAGNHQHNWDDDGRTASAQMLVSLTVIPSTVILHSTSSSAGNTSTDAAHTHTYSITSTGTHTHTITGGGDTETRPYNISVVWAIKAF